MRAVTSLRGDTAWSLHGMHRPLLDEFFTGETFFIVSILVSICQGTELSFLFSFQFFCFFFFHLTQRPPFPCAGLSSLLLSGMTKSWSNAVRDSALFWQSTQGQAKNSRDWWCSSLLNTKPRVSSPDVVEVPGDFLAKAIFYPSKI